MLKRRSSVRNCCRIESSNRLKSIFIKFNCFIFLNIFVRGGPGPLGPPSRSATASEHVLRKFHHCTFPRKISRFFFSHRPFSRTPKNAYIFSLKNSDDLFFSHRPFSRSSHPTIFYFFKSSAFLTSLLHPFTPFYAYPTCCFTRFYTLLCVLVTINTP